MKRGRFNLRTLRFVLYEEERVQFPDSVFCTVENGVCSIFGLVLYFMKRDGFNFRTLYFCRKRGGFNLRTLYFCRKRGGFNLRTLWLFTGPGWLMTIAYLDPGNIGKRFFLNIKKYLLN